MLPSPTSAELSVAQAYADHHHWLQAWLVRRLGCVHRAADITTVTHWFQTLHIGHVWGMPYRVILTGVGVVLAGLSWTGLWLWMRRRQARHRQVCSQPLPS